MEMAPLVDAEDLVEDVEPVRTREPTPSPLPARAATAPPARAATSPSVAKAKPGSFDDVISSPTRTSGELPIGTFAYPTQRNRSRGALKILALLLAAGAGFAAVVYLLPRLTNHESSGTQTAQNDTHAPAKVEPTGSAEATTQPTPTPTATTPGTTTSASASTTTNPTPTTTTPSTSTPTTPSTSTPSTSTSSTTAHPATSTTASTSTIGTKPTITKPTASAKPTTTTTKPTTTKPTATTTSTKPDTTTPKPDTSATSKPGTTQTGETKPAETKPAETKPAGDPGCDEVACVLAKYDRPCCARYKPATTDLKPRAGNTPEELDRAAVREGVEKIKPAVVACGEKAGVKGTVKLSVSVAPDGSVKSAEVAESPDEALGSCVAGAMRKAQFTRTVSGGSFTYPFVF